jgi:hypothetical protein
MARPLTPPRPAPTRQTQWLWLVPALVLATHFGALSVWFAQEDFLYLHQALGSDPTPSWAARFLSLNLWFRALANVFGPNAAVFHAASLVLLAIMGLLVAMLMRRFVKGAPAVATGALVVTSAVVFVPVRWASANSDLLTAALLGGALLVLAGDGSTRRRWLAPVLFVLALWSKEVAVGAAPLLALRELRGPNRSWIRASLYLVVAALVALLAPWRMAGYSTDWAAVPANFARYVAVIVLAPLAAQTSSEGTWVRQPWIALAGGVLAAVWLSVLAWRRDARAWFAAAWFACLIAPVLPLTQQFYFYYATSAMPGLWCSVVLLATGPNGARTPRWLVPTLAIVCAAQLAGVQVRERSRFAQTALPVDATQRRAVIARNAIMDILPHRDALLPAVTVVSQQPVPTASGGTITTDSTGYTADPYWDWSIKNALYDGLALKVFIPQVEDVQFVRWIGPQDSARTVIQCEVDGHARVTRYDSYADVPPFDPADPVVSRQVRASRYIQLHMFPNAARELEEAARLAPNDPSVLLNLGTLYAGFGDTASARGAYERALLAAPQDLDVRFNLGLLHWRSGARAEARRVWAPVLEQAPGSDLARQIRGALEAGPG